MIFSIIIPTKNEELYIRQCLRSIFSTTYPREQYEVIVVDNGSEDATVEIASEFDVRFFLKPELNTISAVRNFGAGKSVGVILCFLDADCTVEEGWLSSAERHIHDKSIVCFGASPLIPENATWIEKTWLLVRKPSKVVVEKKWQESTNMFIRKELYELVGGFNEDLITCEDVDLSYRLGSYGKIISDPELIVIHHRDPKTVKQFFYKECWRGEGNYVGIKNHGLKFDELVSLIMPIFYLILSILFVKSWFVFDFWRSIVVLCFWQFPMVTQAVVKVIKQHEYKQLGELTFLYNIYYAARCIAIYRMVKKRINTQFKG